MGQLTNQFVSQSYQGLLNLENANTGVTSTLQYVTDGIGNKLPMLASTSSIVISGSFYGDGSNLTGITAVSASYAQNATSASYAQNATSSSFSLNATSASFAQTTISSSFAQNAVSSSHAVNADTSISSSFAQAAISSSFASNATSASFAQAAISSSFASNATSASFAQSAVSSSYSLNSTSASFAQNAVSSSHAVNSDSSISSSFSQNAVSSSFAQSAISSSWADNSLSSSFAQTAVSASQAQNAVSSSHALNANTASYVLNAVSSSHAEYADDAGLLNGTGSAVFATTGSNTFNGSQNILGGLQVQNDASITGSLHVDRILNEGSVNLEILPDTLLILGKTTTTSSLRGQLEVDNTRIIMDCGDITGATNLINLDTAGVTITGSIKQSGTFFPDVIDWFSSSIQQGTGSYILTTDANGVTQYDTYTNVANKLIPDLTGSFNRNGLITTGSIGGNQSITGSLDVQGTISATSASFTYVNTVYETASVIYSSGSNQLGDASNDTQTLYGTVVLPNGPLNVTGSALISNILQVENRIYTEELYGSTGPDMYIGSTYNGATINITEPYNTGSFAGQVRMSKGLNVTGSFVASGSLHRLVGNTEVTGNLVVSGSQLQVQANNGIQVTNPADNTSYYNVQIETGSFKKIAMNMFTEKSFIQGYGDLFFLNTWDANSSGSIGFNSANQINFLATSSVNISGSNNVDIKSSTISATGSLSVSGSNHRIIGDVNLTGSLIASGSSHKIIGNTEITGSLGVLGSGSFTNGLKMFASASYANSAVQPGAYVSESAPVSQSNIYFSQATGVGQVALAANLTGSIVVSGSNNIFSTANRINTLVTQGTYGFVGGNNNLVQAIPTITTSSVALPSTNGNYFQGAVVFGFTSSSLQTPVFSNNNVNAAVTINHQSGSVNAVNNLFLGNLTSTQQITTGKALPNINNNIFTNTTTLTHTSSSISYQNNIAGGFTVRNEVSSSFSAATNGISLANNFVQGQSLTLFASGSASSAQIRNFNNNWIGGQNTTVSSSYVNSNNAVLTNTLIFGQGLIVSASSQPAANQGGSVFVGRFNDTGSLNLSQTNVFVVGTGTADATRRTGFWIDNNSNTNVSGALNVIGNSTITGSLNASGSSHKFIGSTNITGSINIEGTTFMSSSGGFPLTVDGTMNTRRIHFNSNPFNNDPSSNLGAIRFDASNQTLYFTNYDLAQITTQSLIGQTIITGSNFVKTSLQSSNAGTDAYLDLINSAGTRTLDVKVDTTKITGSLNVSGSSHRFDGSTSITGSLGVTETATINGITIKSGSSQSTAVGNQALANVTEQDNTALGRWALRQLTIGRRNTAVGSGAGQALVSGSDNQFFGNDSGWQLPSGSENVFFGTFAGNSIVSGSGNLFVGNSSANQFVSGNFNTIIGNATNGNYTSGSRTTIIGCTNHNFGINDLGDDLFAIGRHNSDPILIKKGSGPVRIPHNTLITGSLEVTGSVTISNAGDLTVYGHKQFNAGEFWSNTTQSGSAGVSGSIMFDASGSVAGVSLVSGSRLTVANAGTYNIQFSAQVETSAGSDTAYVWYKKNGTNIGDSATKVVLANNTAQVMTVNILDQAAANDYYELGYQFTNGNATLLAEAASGNIPAIPSVIATVTQAR